MPEQECCPQGVYTIQLLPIQPYEPQLLPEQYTYPQAIQPSWIQSIVPVLMGVMMMVVIASMVRDLFKGGEVTMPPMVGTGVKTKKV